MGGKSVRPSLRLARLGEEDAIEALMRSSILHFFPAYYDDRQVQASLKYVGVPDADLISDGTYYVAEDDAGLIAAGGWSKRTKLYAGSAAAEDDDRLLDPTTEPAHIRAMFVRPRLGTAWTRSCDRRGVRSGREERGLYDDVADGHASRRTSLPCVRFPRGRTRGRDHAGRNSVARAFPWRSRSNRPERSASSKLRL
jgi:hypothetical protein